VSEKRQLSIHNFHDPVQIVLKGLLNGLIGFYHWVKHNHTGSCRAGIWMLLQFVEWSGNAICNFWLNQRFVHTTSYITPVLVFLRYVKTKCNTERININLLSPVGIKKNQRFVYKQTFGYARGGMRCPWGVCIPFRPFTSDWKFYFKIM
jgi:hypothetical protein